MKITEEHLCFLWEEIIPGLKEIFDEQGNLLKVIQPGYRNINTGPDFFNTLLEKDGLRWAGNVEIHVKASDWKKHGHDMQSVYDNIILHVVWENDLPLNLRNIPVLELKKYISPELFSLEKYNDTLRHARTLPCHAYHSSVQLPFLYHWLERMAVERWEERCNTLEKKFIYFDCNWQQLFYSVMMEAYGFHTNALPMFALSDRVHVDTALRERDSVFRLESLWLGTAGLLFEMPHSEMRNLRLREFEYLKQKYSLEPLAEGSFRTHGLRPANHPCIRIQQFARMFYNLSDLFQTLNWPSNLPDLEKILLKAFEIPHNTREYEHIPVPGKTSLHLIILNGWSLFLFFYGMKTSKEDLKQLSMELLSTLPFERNHKTRHFQHLPLTKAHALHSQAEIHLFNEYCRKKRCASCDMGRKIMKGKNI